MEINECFITTAGEDWVRIENCNVHMNVKRRLQRTVIRGNEGDDLLDEGAESAVYTITGNMDMEKNGKISVRLVQPKKGRSCNPQIKAVAVHVIMAMRQMFSYLGCIVLGRNCISNME